MGNSLEERDDWARADRMISIPLGRKTVY